MDTPHVIGHLRDAQVHGRAGHGQGVLEGLERRPVAPTLARRLERMRGKTITSAMLKGNAAYLAATENLARIRQS